MRSFARTKRLAGTLAVSAAALFASSPAGAFCRTKTVLAPANFDSTLKGCFEGGVPLFWRNACVGYDVHDPPSRKVSYDDASNAISIAFTRWTGASCPTDGIGRSRASIDVRDLGPVACATVEQLPNKDNQATHNQNVIIFRDDEWIHGPEVLGLTIVSFLKETGEILGADMEINTKDMEPVTFRDPDPVDNVARVDGKKAYDFLSIVTHEAGHFLGIAHSEKKEATMYARYNPGEVYFRDLAPDDVNAVCSIYRPDGTRPVLGDKIYSAPGCDPTPRGGLSRECDSPSSSCEVGRAPGRDASCAVGWALAAALGLSVARRGREANAPREKGVGPGP